MILIVVALGCSNHAPEEGAATGSPPSEASPTDSVADTSGAPTDTGSPTTTDTGTPPCEPLVPGTTHDLVFEHGGTERIYSLHVPEGLDCHAPVLVDLHGAYGGPDPEKAYVLEEALQAADDLGYVLLRPRGLPIQRYGREWYYWNVAHQLEQNADFLDAVAATVATDGPRWVIGYSSGADLTGWMLSRQRGWDGYGLVAGASWSTHTWEPFAGSGPPLYTQMGSRDDLASHDLMLSELDAADHPTDQRFVDVGAGGHRLDRIHYERAIPWFRDGARPPRAPSDGDWVATAVSDVPLLAIDPGTVDGAVRVADAQGTIWTDGVDVPRGDGPINGLCDGLAAGFGIATPLDGGGPLPVGGVGYAYAHHVACGTTEALAAGADVYTTSDGGLTWTIAPRSAQAFGEWYSAAVSGEVAAAVGQYNRISVRRGAAAAWDDVVITPFQERWLYGVAVDAEPDPKTGQQAVWVVGEDGWVGRSIDEDRFLTVAELGDLPLYAVAARGERVAVGGHDGGVWLSVDRGATFVAVPLDVASVTALAFGEDDLVATASDGAVWRRPL